MVVTPINASLWEAEAGGLLQVQSQLELHSENLFHQNKTNKQTRQQKPNKTKKSQTKQRPLH